MLDFGKVVGGTGFQQGEGVDPELIKQIEEQKERERLAKIAFKDILGGGYNIWEKYD